MTKTLEGFNSQFRGGLLSAKGERILNALLPSQQRNPDSHSKFPSAIAENEFKSAMSY